MTTTAAPIPSKPATSATPAPTDELRRIPLAEVHESPLNPRKRFDPAKLEQLKDSLLASGQLTPAVVRPRKGGGYEIGAGHRRYRAAKLACEKHAQGAAHRGLDHLLAIVRPLDDRAFVELLNIENLQRDDLHALEEAQGFRDLMTECGYDVKKIAGRIGKSDRYVYDSLTLLKLIPGAKKLFLEGEFERGHAIELARLSPEWQEQALGTKDARESRVAGLFQAEEPDVDPAAPKQERLELEDAVKPVSVREFKKWVNDKVRFRPAETDPMLFPDTSSLLGKATVEKEKVIEISYEYQIPDEAKDPELVGDKAPKVYGARSWRSATKGHPSPETYQYGRAHAGEGKPCEHSVVGVIVIGDGRGEAFRVCIAKEQCKVHWADWQRERAQRQKPGGGSASAGKQRDSHQEQQDRWRREEEKRQADRKRWAAAQPAILKAVAEKIAVAPAGPTSKLADAVLEACSKRKPNNAVPRGRTPEDLIRHAAFQLYVDDVHDLAPGSYDHPRALKNLRTLGVDAEKIVDEVAPKPPAKPAAAVSPRSVSCPQCHAKPGSPCMRPSGHPVFGGDFHAGRVKAATAVKAKAPAKKKGKRK